MEDTLESLGKDWIPIKDVSAEALKELDRLVSESERHLEWKGDGITVSCPTNIMRKTLAAAAPGTAANPQVIHDHPGVSPAILEAVANLTTQ